VNNTPTFVKINTYSGLFLLTLSTLMYEILLTRFFSVIMWYHLAFMAISIAMFGMSVGAIIVYIFPGYFKIEKSKYYLSLGSFLFSITMVFSMFTMLVIPFPNAWSLTTMFALGLNYIIISIPFIFSGICVSIALTRFPGKIGSLYAADLSGSAVGCILLIYILKITDGPTTMLIISIIASVGALLFWFDFRKEQFNNILNEDKLLEDKINDNVILKKSNRKNMLGSKKLFYVIITYSFFILIFISLNTILQEKQKPLITMPWVKGFQEERPLYQKWNSFSRIAVFGDTIYYRQPQGWGFSNTFPRDIKSRWLALTIDGAATTVLTKFNGDLKDIGYLKYDVTNLAHFIRTNSNILVIGVGGGRDILSALVFNQKSILAVEINEDIIKAVNNRYGDFTGHLDRHPKVTFINDEARSYIARSREKFDIIQVSLIDTWAATAAGSFVLTENSLYTTQAWNSFYNHLSDSGMISFSRWYSKQNPGEMYRLVSLAVSTLKNSGVKLPKEHIMIVANNYNNAPEYRFPGVGTILISKKPFSENEINSIENVARTMNFDVVFSPRYISDSILATMVTNKDLDNFYSSYYLNLKPPTDDSPFFFQLLKIKNFLNFQAQHNTNHNQAAVKLLVVLFLIVSVLTMFCIIVPLYISQKNAHKSVYSNKTSPLIKDADQIRIEDWRQKLKLSVAFPYFIYFASIGMGFMFIEISQMQRLIIFLGHPVYGLSVVLFALLLSTGIGSFLTQRIELLKNKTLTILCFSFLLAILFIFGLLTPNIILNYQSDTTPLRIFVSIIILFPLGLFMGIAFPLGMKLASEHLIIITPWLWGINGATSVLASVLAVVIALATSISVTFWTGFICYLIAVLVFLILYYNRQKITL
jgi:predicted membrane-bound spermidine synthase